MPVWTLAWLLTGCAQSPQPLTPQEKPVDTTLTTATTTGTSTTDTVDTAVPTTSTVWDCSTLPTVPVSYTALGDYSSAEDFDFDADGYVGVVYDTNLVAKNQAGDTRVISPGVGSWTSGTRVLSTGEWVVADSSTGAVLRIDPLTGSQTNVYTGFSWPNGIDVGANDMLFISDFSNGTVLRVDAHNPTDFEVIGGGLDLPNGVILSPNEETLYVVLSWTAALIAFDVIPGGGWSDPRMVYLDPGGNYQGLNIDICGNLYITDIRPGGTSNILRVTPDGLHADVVVNLPSGYVPNIRFGHGVGGWDELKLYASDRDQGRIFEIDVGILGTPHVALP